jgi:hypothetical protein
LPRAGELSLGNYTEIMGLGEVGIMYPKQEKLHKQQCGANYHRWAGFRKSGFIGTQPHSSCDCFGATQVERVESLQQTEWPAKPSDYWLTLYRKRLPTAGIEKGMKELCGLMDNLEYVLKEREK